MFYGEPAAKAISQQGSQPILKRMVKMIYKREMAYILTVKNTTLSEDDPDINYSKSFYMLWYNDLPFLNRSFAGCLH